MRIGFRRCIKTREAKKSVIASAGALNIQPGIGAKQSSAAVRRYVCYAPGNC
ncbi:MAG: hypothetical protein LBM98_10070 [Oscillospiraceae bacterium]|nr:hypothetical protein [Oscillospiraceae bacterium]